MSNKCPYCNHENKNRQDKYTGQKYPYVYGFFCSKCSKMIRPDNDPLFVIENREKLKKLKDKVRYAIKKALFSGD